MKKFTTRMALAAAALSAATLVPSAFAQTVPLYIIAGSSAQFNTLGYANFYSGGPLLTGPNSWTYKSGTNVAAGGSCTATTTSPTVVIHDNRNSSSVTIADEPGTVWVSWNSDELLSPRGPNAKLSAFINVDSSVGVRAALARPSASLVINVPAGTCGENKVPNQTDAASGLPATVLADLNTNPTITIAAADIRAEDAKFATTRALTTLGGSIANTTRQNVKGLGYGGLSGPSVGYPVEGGLLGGVANPVDFALFGSDPISGQAAFPSIQELNVGAGPVMVFVNTTNTGTGHFGDPNLTDADEWPLAALFSAKTSRTRDLFHATGLGSFPARMFIREPVSGTYNTFEYNILNTARELTTQETGITAVAPTPAAQNPLAETIAATGGGRTRVIGTGNMVSAVSATADSIGYAFWGYGNFAGVASTTAKYLTVNGVDPLFSSYSGGAFPQKSGTTFPVIPFPHVADGSYPIWTIYRLVVGDLNYLANAQTLITAAQSEASLVSDFIPAPSLGVFRSHYYQSSVGPYNGHKTGFPSESGGDVGGAPLPIQQDLDTILDTGFESYQELQ